MYLSLFGLKHEPFSIAPDPRYLFMSERHREALAHLLYGVRGGGGFVLLTGEIGAGKTTVCRCFLEQIPKRVNVAYIFNPKLTVEELLRTVCDEFHVPAAHPGQGRTTVKDYVDALNEFLLKTHAVGQNNVLIIDEAQNLSADVLEQLRLLTNLETNERKLLQIVLIGQPELRSMLARPELEQLAQRVTARFHLDALTLKETVQYIRHRLAIAGMNRPTPFERDALLRIFEVSRGLPRRINLLCDRALLGAYASGKARADREIVDKAALEVFGRDERAALRRPAARRAAVFGVGALAGAVLVGAAMFAFERYAQHPAVVAAPAAAASLPAAAASAPETRVDTAAAGAAASAAASAPAAPGAAALVLTAADLAARFGSVHRDERDAWRELAASVWNLPLGGADPCLAAQRQQVLCFRSGGFTPAVLRQLGRPGIVTLHDDTKRPVHALLTGLNATTATLRMGGTSQTVTLDSFAALWRGDYAALWRAPPGYVGGDANVGNGAWLAVRLAKARGEGPPEVTPDAAALKTQIQAFQTAQALKVDGFAGPLTLMQLNRASGVDEPRLLAEHP
jgi:general secretion pathway protein A